MNGSRLHVPLDWLTRRQGLLEARVLHRRRPRWFTPLSYLLCVDADFFAAGRSYCARTQQLCRLNSTNIWLLERIRSISELTA